MTKEQTHRLLKNYFNARKSWEGWCYLNNINLIVNSPLVKNYANNNGFIGYYRYLLCKDFHIELYKIIKESRNSNDNIFTLLKTQNLPQSKIQLNKLNKHKTIFESIINTRDKFYAHLDDNYLDFNGICMLDDFNITFKLIEESIIVLGKENELIDCLKEIPSRNEFIIKI